MKKHMTPGKSYSVVCHPYPLYYQENGQKEHDTVIGVHYGKLTEGILVSPGRRFVSFRQRNYGVIAKEI